MNELKSFNFTPVVNSELFELILINFGLHIALNDQEKMTLRSRLLEKRLKKKEHLLVNGMLCKNIYFVCSGCLRTYYRDKEGEEHNVLFCPENWWATDMLSFSQHTAATYNINALEDTVVLYVSYTTLEQLYIEIPKLERFFRILMQNGFSLFQSRLTSNISQSAPQRYKRFQQQYPTLEKRISQKHIASYLGITPVFLSMIRNST
jgi:CRP-like cAMP-binding protein